MTDVVKVRAVIKSADADQSYLIYEVNVELPLCSGGDCIDETRTQAVRGVRALAADEFDEPDLTGGEDAGDDER